MERVCKKEVSNYSLQIFEEKVNASKQNLSHKPISS